MHDAHAHSTPAKKEAKGSNRAIGSDAAGRAL